MTTLSEHWNGLALLAAAVLFGLCLHALLFKIGGIFARRTTSALDDSILKHGRGPLRLIIPALFAYFLFPLLDLSPAILLFIRQIFSLVLIGAVAWMIINITNVLEDVAMSQYKLDVADNLRARRIHTQIQILKKVFILIVGVLTMAAILMTFDRVRHVGTSILASAGVIGIIVGLAAQRSIATLLAGIQIALTQPIRYDDVVIVENEWGRIEEITLTYVVVRIWDQRRLIVPITYFLEKPFQNWTRISADLLGTVFLHVDYRAPIEAIREELRRIVEDSQKWDGRVWVLQVTGATERTMELRALVSARDSSNAWELRCEVRERLIKFLQEQIPEALPRLRAEISEQESRGSGQGVKERDEDSEPKDRPRQIP